jgi:hypothetical protein
MNIAKEFLEEVYRLNNEGTIEDATDLIFSTIDRLLCGNEFSAIDNILINIDIEKLSTSLMRSFLTITYAGKDHLKNRDDFYNIVEVKMKELKGEEKTKKILKELK